MKTIRAKVDASTTDDVVGPLDCLILPIPSDGALYCAITEPRSRLKGKILRRPVASFSLDQRDLKQLEIQHAEQ